MSQHQRVHARFACDLPVSVHAERHKLALARFTNIGVGGASLDCETALEKGGAYDFWFTWVKEKLRIAGRIAWRADLKEPKITRYGVMFDELTTKQMSIMRIVIDNLRQQQWPHKDPTLGNYWGV